MKKRFLSLLCVLALCMGLLPVTALAADGIELYVGGQQIKESGCYENQNGTWKKVDGTEPANGQFSYDADTFTLTLNQAMIVNYQDVTVGGGFTYPGSVIAFSQSADVSLKIVASQGTSNITGTGGIRVVSKAGDASLSISGPGSLEVKNVSNDSGIVLIGSKNVNLGINSADVTISNVQYYGVQLAAGDACKSTATINDGNLTVSDSVVGIYFMRLYTSGPSSLTVSGNAMVDTEGSTGGIINGFPDSFQIGADGESGGIVFNGNSGTVYGNVTLQEDLEIGTDETLTIGKDASLTVPDGKILTNNGTVTTEEGGTLTGNITNAPPKINTEGLSEGTVNTEYNQTLAADNNPTSWSVTNGTLPNGLTLENGTISGTPTAAGTSTFTVKAENTAGSDSKELTLTINPAPVLVTSVTLNTSELSLYTGQSETLIVTVAPDNATNPDVTWSSDKPEVATVENGEVTAKAAGTATITATAADGSGKSANCKVTVTQSEYSISADTTAIDFGSAYTGYTQPAAQTVTITNTGNQSLTLNQPASTSNFEVGTLTKTVLAAGEAATFTVQPEAGLAVGTYSDDITVSGTNNVNATISATFTVRQYSSGGGSSSSTPSVSEQTIDKIEAAKDGSTVSIKLPVGRTTLEGEVFETLAGQDITLEISLSNGVTWTVNGQDIPENAKLSDLDLGVTLDASTIPVSVVNTITGTVDTIQLSLKHDGEFGFTMTLSAPLGKTNAGYWANLYYYNEETKALEFQAASRIASDGTAEFAFSHASDYAIVIDTDSHEPVELPFTDVPEGAWYEDAAAYVYKHGLMAGTSATTFAPDVTTSRAMIATILWRMAGSPVVNYAMTYTDVAQGQWYSEAVRWATSEGVVTGYGNGLFGTNDPITREQLATMLWRYAQTEGYDVSIGEDTNILSYTDVADLSEYAIPAMQWAVGAGIINGTGDGSTLTPQGQATRAQAAVMLMRFCEEYVVW